MADKYYIDSTGIHYYRKGYYDDMEKKFMIDFSKPPEEWQKGLDSLIYCVSREAREEAILNLKSQFRLLREVLGA